MLTKPLILQGETHIRAPAPEGENKKIENSLLTRKSWALHSEAKIWYNSLDFGEGVAIGLAGGTGPKEVLRVAELEPGQ